MRKITRHAALQALDAVMQEPSIENYRPISPQLAAFRKNNAEWLLDNRIVGYGFAGRGGVAGNAKGSPIVSFYVDSDEYVDALMQDAVPATVKLPGVGIPLQTEVVNIGNVRPTALTTRTRPIHPGMSISHIKMSAGTFGCFAKSRTPGDESLYILGSNHVLTDFNTPSSGDAVIQPGRTDRGRLTDKIAEVARFIELIYDDRAYVNTADAAIARVVDRTCDPSEGSGMVPMRLNRTARRNGRVSMIGRTSGLSTGHIKDPAARIRIPYPRSPRSTSFVGFEDVILCTPFTRSGDSGASVKNESNEIIGLVMAGSDRASIVCKIGYVVDQLNIDLVAVAL